VDVRRPPQCVQDGEDRHGGWTVFPDRGGRHLRDRRNGARRKETRTRRPMERRRVGRRGTKAYRVARRGDVCKHRVKQMSTILRRSSTRLYSATGTALRFRSRPPMEAKRLGPDAGPEIRPSQRHLAGVGPTPSTPAGSARVERADTPRGDAPPKSRTEAGSAPGPCPLRPQAVRSAGMVATAVVSSEPKSETARAWHRRLSRHFRAQSVVGLEADGPARPFPSKA